MPNAAVEHPPDTIPNVMDDNPFMKRFAHLAAVDDPVDESAERAKQQAVKREAARVALAEVVGARYADCTLANFQATSKEQRAAVDQLKAIGLADFVRAGRGLIFYGTVGTGKDHLLAAMLFRAVAAGCSCYWINGLELLATFRDAIDSQTSERSLVKRFASYDVLAISDPTPPIPLRDDAWRTELLYRILDARYRAAKSTWLTVNAKSPKDADELLTSQVFDRLRDGAELVKCLWQSYREPQTKGK